MRLEVYSKSGDLIAGWEVDESDCSYFREKNDEEILLEVAGMISAALKAEEGLDLTPIMVLREIGKLVICGREVEIGGNPAS